MRAWLIQTGEPLPIDGEAPRLLRTGIVARALSQRGHDVTWWCSTFNHWTKSHRYASSTTVEMTSQYRLRLVHSPGYRRNVSLARFIDHRILARTFSSEINRESPPDVILCSFPTIEMAEVATEFGRQHRVPVIMDVRDLWPDAFLNFVPDVLRPLARLFLHGTYSQARRALQECDAIVGVSQSYLEWGLELARRSQRETDAVFPLGYERSSPARGDLQNAERQLRGVGVDPDRTICWFIGTFGRTYDIATVINVARSLRQRNDMRAQFVLSGDGGNIHEYRQMARGLDNVIFTGWLNSSGIEWMMRSARIGLAAYAPDAPQSLPNKLFEYLSAGLPIVSSLGNEARDLLERNACGSIYRPGDALSLASAIVALLESPATLSAMSDAALKTFQENYSTERIYVPFLDYLEGFTRVKREPRTIP